MQKLILIPLDGTPVAERVLPSAVALARTGYDGIVLLQSITSPVGVASTIWTMPPTASIWDGWEEEARVAQEYLNGIAERLQAEGVKVHMEVCEDEPANAIVSYAAKHPQIALVAMATHGRSGLGRWVLGSVAEQVLHSISVPVLLVRSQQTGALPLETVGRAVRTILVPLDGSPFAEQALRQAEIVAQSYGSKIALVTALPHSHGGATAEADAEATRMRGYIEKVAERLRNESLQVTTKMVQGDPAEAILQASHDLGADLLAMSTHGRSGIQRMLLGSVVMKVVQGSSLPVLVVRPAEVRQHAAEAGKGPEVAAGSR